jgi:FMN phosphatase YigB (HAD superfamily)
LDVDEEIAGERIFKAKRETDKNTTKKQAINEVRERNSSDEARYLKLYNVDLRNPNNYNLVIDTSERSPEEVLQIILDEFSAYKWKHQIAETPEEKKLLRESKAKTKLLKDIALLLASILITCWWLFTTVNEKKKAELRENDNANINDEVSAIVDDLE